MFDLLINSSIAKYLIPNKDASPYALLNCWLSNDNHYNDYSPLLGIWWNSALRTYFSNLRDRKLPDFASGHRSFQFEIQ